jgi:hypothetical protein
MRGSMLVSIGPGIVWDAERGPPTSRGSPIHYFGT